MIINKRNYPALDGIRFVLAILIFFTHFTRDEHYFFEWIFQRSFVFIMVFLTLSGFLITNNIYEEYKKNQNIHILNFIKKRIYRLMPGWILTLIVSITYLFFFIEQSQIVKERFIEAIPYYLLNFSNYHQSYNGHFIPLLSHFWTLAVEEQFYLIWPILFLFWLKKYRFRLLVVAVGLIIPYITRVYNLNHQYGNWTLHSLFDVLFGGCLLGIFWTKIPRITKTNSYFLLIVMVLFFYLGLHLLIPYKLNHSSPWLASLIWNCCSIGSLLLIIICVKCPDNLLSKAFATGPLSYLGVFSYEFYLVHMLIIDFMMKYLLIYQWSIWVKMILVISVCLMSSFLLYVTIGRFKPEAAKA